MSTDQYPYAQFGDWLAEQLAARGYDLSPRGGGRTRFAKDAGINPHSLGRALRGVERPNTTTLGRIAERLGVQVAPLLVMCGYLDKDQLPAAGPPTKGITQRQALEALGVTDPQHQAAVLTMIDALKGGASS